MVGYPRYERRDAVLVVLFVLAIALVLLLQHVTEPAGFRAPAVRRYPTKVSVTTTTPTTVPISVRVRESTRKASQRPATTLAPRSPTTHAGTTSTVPTTSTTRQTTTTTTRPPATTTTTACPKLADGVCRPL